MARAAKRAAGPVEGPWALPEGWRWEALGSIGRWGSGGTPKAKTPEYYGGGFPWYKIGDLTDGVLRGSSDTISQAGLDASSAKWVPAGALLVAMYGSIGKLGLTTEPVTTNQAIAFCIPAEQTIDLRYLFYFLLFRRQHLLALGQGGTQQNISQTILLEELITLPELGVQRAIVARIDELFAEIDDGEAALARARDDLATWRKALLKAAVTGDLTADWRAERLKQDGPPAETGPALLARLLADRRARWEAEPRNRGKRYVEPVAPEVDTLASLPEGWCWATIDQLSTRVTKGSSPGWQGFEYQEQGILFIRSQNVGWGDLRLEDRVYVDPNFNAIESKAIVQQNDVLLNIVGASIGRACAAGTQLEGANTNQAVAGIRPVHPGLSDWIVAWLVSPVGQAAVFANVVETARANLSLEQVRVIPVPLPPDGERGAVLASCKQATDVDTAVTKQAMGRRRGAERGGVKSGHW